MNSTNKKLKILFFPFLAPGHILPMVNMAKLFAARGTAATFLTTPANSALIQPIIDFFNSSSKSPIQLHLIPFPSAAVGLPDGYENLSCFASSDAQLKFLKTIDILRNPFDQLLRELCPDCVVTDTFLPWTYEVATKLGIPRISFDGSNFFAKCAEDSIVRHKVFECLPPESETIILPSLPHHMELLRSQVIEPSKMPPSMVELFKQAKEADSNSYGLVVNSFYELESDYIDYYRKVIGGKAWHIGPVAFCNHDDMSRGKECLKWLDGKKPRSVVYMCFGSLAEFTTTQLREIAIGLETSGHSFVWVLRNSGEEWIPEGYEERIEGRGLLIKEWAPQLMILNHEAVGGFITHCGWNSILEGITAGLPMGTWPLYAEQFFNEKFVVDVLKIGVEVGSMVLEFKSENRPVVNAADLETAVRSVMGEGEEAEKRRNRAKELKELARKAVEVGGSSYNDLGNLIERLVEKKVQAL